MIYTKLAVALCFALFVILELAHGRFGNPKTATRKDHILDAASALLVPLIALQGVLAGSNWLARTLAPHWKGALSHWPWWVMFPVLLLADDFTQYWWHRASHSGLLYPLHRAHHSAPYLSVRVVYRNNLVYYLMMPGLLVFRLSHLLGVWPRVRGLRGAQTGGDH